MMDDAILRMALTSALKELDAIAARCLVVSSVIRLAMKDEPAPTMENVAELERGRMQ